MTPEQARAEERAKVVAFLERQSRESMWLSDSLPWWRFRLKFANHVAAAACLNLLGKIHRGDHCEGGSE